MQTLKVSSKTDPKKLAVALCESLKESGGEVTLQAVGAGAVNQAVKGIIIARGLAAPEGADLKTVPGFAETELDGRQITAVRFRVLWR
ncbi:stage V sporulation protein S [Desulfothermobacter acidiphilus]|uniref:stage V sporulation protein S n=1 Tax=Desulfothermobacter acidiphilus TaxID=1938353 RepID=UPI003F8914AF